MALLSCGVSVNRVLNPSNADSTLVQGSPAGIPVVAVDREIVSIRRMGAGVKITRKICAIVMAFAWFAVVPKVSQAQSDSAARAIPAAEKALEAATRRLGPTDPRTLSNRRMLAGLYELQGRLDDATTLMQREATTLMQAEGKNSVNLAETLNRLALIHRKAGREREADKILAQALKIYRSQPAARRRPPPPGAWATPKTPQATKPAPNVRVDPPVRKVPVSKVSVAPARVPSGVQRASRQWLVPERRAPPRGLSVSGAPDNTARPSKLRPPTARESQYLERAARRDREAQDLWWQRRIVDVERKYREALRYRETVLGGDHPDVGHSLIRLARLYWGMDRHREASAMHRRAISILERHLPAADPDLAEAMWELGGFLRLRGDYRSAYRLMLKAMAVFEKTPGNRTKMLQRRAAYAAVLGELGRGEEAALIKR